MKELLTKILDKNNMPNFFVALTKYGSIYAPVKVSEKTHSFQSVSSLDEVDLDYNRTMIPPKKLFISPEETIFTFNRKNEKFIEQGQNNSTQVLLGVHSCDIHALNLLAKVFLKEFTDKYYAERRERTLLVGLSCTPDEHCFCKSTGTDYVNEGFELFLHDIGDQYLVRIGSQKGFNFVQENSTFFDEVTESHLNQFKETENERMTKFTSSLEMSGLQDMLDLSYDNKLWEEYGEKCLGCGSCNLVCPRCRCYDVQDYVDLNLTTGERVRKWYSCMLKDHGLVAGGHNFRPSSKERIRNRFNCKGSLREEMPNCVGCGRCSTYCPAGIDFLEVMKKVRGEI